MIVQAWCLCAAWCDACKAYRATFDSVCAQTLVQGLWIDVEDHAERIEPLDIENFPTLLIAVRPDNAAPLHASRAVYLGPVMPQAGVLQNLLSRAQSGDLLTLTRDHVAHALLQRLLQHETPA